MKSAVVLLLLSLVPTLHGHGFMTEPPARNFLWKLDFDVMAFYNLMGLNCGGFFSQWTENGGKCGVCGDNYRAVIQTFVNDARYITDLIPRVYKPGSTIDVSITITANHKGCFMFKVGEQQGIHARHEDLTHDVMVVSDGGLTNKYCIGSDVKKADFKVKLPNDLTCNRCLFQWTWKTGNSYGCELGICGIGLGEQETFVNCADIRIESTSGTTGGTGGSAVTTTTTVSPTTTASGTGGSTGGSTGVDGSHEGEMLICKASSEVVQMYGDAADDVCVAACKGMTDLCDEKRCDCKYIATPKRVVESGCKAIRAYSFNIPMNAWCKVQCAAGFCPSTHCSCDDYLALICHSNSGDVTTQQCIDQCNMEMQNCPSACACILLEKRWMNCVAAGQYEGDLAVNSWCRTNCPAGYCPETHCKCTVA